MISGQVNSNLEAVISVSVHGKPGEIRSVDAVIDSGFAGHLTLTPAVISALELNRIAIGQLTLADGSQVLSDLYQAAIVWDGQTRTIEVDALDTETLVGMALMEGYDLNMRIIRGGQVSLDRFLPTGN